MMRSFIPIGFLVCLCGMGSALAQGLEFQVLREIPVGQPFAGPYSVAAADFDGDGKTDLAVGEYDGGAVVILPGNGDGTFRSGVRIPVAGSVKQIAVADLNGDGYLDIVAACSTATNGTVVFNEVVVLLGLGDGTFGTPVRVPVATATWGILAADLDGDGIPDLAVGQAGKLLFLAGKGDGTFQDPVELPTPAQGAGDDSPVMLIRSADLNLDGKPDLITVHRSSPMLSLLISTPEGGYLGQVLSDQNIGYAHDVAIADFNQDGTPDLGLCGDDGCQILTGNGDVTFQAAGFVAEPARTMAVAVGDFDGDGVPDLILGNYYGGKISVLLGQGDGTFREMPPIHSKGDTFGIAVADLNGDGTLDVVAANHSSKSVTVALGQGGGKFQGAMTLASSQAVLGAADLDGDGKPDLVVVNTVADRLDILRGASELLGTYSLDENPSSVYFGDLSGDGIPDLIVPGGRRGDGGSWLEYASVLLGTGGGSFQQGDTIAPGRVAAVADFDGDGRADLAVITIAWTTQILLNQGDGTFQPAGEIEGIGGYGPAAVADFNRDGLPDLADVSQGAIRVFLGTGHGTFQAAVRYSLPENPTAMQVADFNGDGNLDVAVASQSSVCLLLGAADGSLQPGPCTAVGMRPGWDRTMVVGDFDGDGRTDLAMAETVVGGDYASGFFSSSVIWVYAGTGDGKFRPPERAFTTPANWNVSSLLPADFDGDGQTDLAAALYSFSGGEGTVLILGRSRTQ